MSLNESTVEATALEWFRLHRGFGGQVGAPHFASCGKLRRARLGYASGHGATFAKLRRAKPHHQQSRTLATLRDPAVAGLPKLLSGELSLPAEALAQAGVAGATGKRDLQVQPGGQ